MQYLELKLAASEERAEILIAQLAEIGFDSFSEEEGELKAYIQQDLYSEEQLKEILHQYAADVPYTVGLLEDKNWNEEWEKNFSPVFISDQCMIRAPFHDQDKRFPYEIIINPKMSFGTGHHETTSMMVGLQLSVDHKGKNVMDAGSGTGILAIMAEKLGASSVFAFDLEDWAFGNMPENFTLNNCQKISFAQGTVSTVTHPHKSYDIILANINKNVLLEEMDQYANLLSDKGLPLLSGFYIEDVKDLVSKAESVGLKKEKAQEKNRWAALIFSKK